MTKSRREFADPLIRGEDEVVSENSGVHVRVNHVPSSPVKSGYVFLLPMIHSSKCTCLSLSLSLSLDSLSEATHARSGGRPEPGEPNSGSYSITVTT
jgi:hypothetical protein